MTSPNFVYDAHPDLVADFDAVPRMFIPEYDASHKMTGVLLQHAIGEEANFGNWCERRG